MRPTRPPSGKVDLFRERLEAIIDPHHALVRLAGLVPWSRFDEAFGRFYRPIGRPAKPTRLMVGLHYLKHVHDLSDEEVVARWVENPYWQFFCGFDFFQHEAPLDASTMTRWRKRIGRKHAVKAAGRRPLFLRNLGRRCSGSSFIGDDLARVVDAVLSEGGQAVLADAVHPETAVLRLHVNRQLEEPILVFAEKVGDVADGKDGADRRHG